jgi:hypothetical protein
MILPLLGERAGVRGELFGSPFFQTISVPSCRVRSSEPLEHFPVRGHLM